jgi:hypothetical protein
MFVYLLGLRKFNFGGFYFLLLFVVLRGQTPDAIVSETLPD